METAKASAFDHTLHVEYSEISLDDASDRFLEFCMRNRLEWGELWRFSIHSVGTVSGSLYRCSGPIIGPCRWDSGTEEEIENKITHTSRSYARQPEQLHLDLLGVI